MLTSRKLFKHFILFILFSVNILFLLLPVFSVNDGPLFEFENLNTQIFIDHNIVISLTHVAEHKYELTLCYDRNDTHTAVQNLWFKCYLYSIFLLMHERKYCCAFTDKPLWAYVCEHLYQVAKRHCIPLGFNADWVHQHPHVLSGVAMDARCFPTFLSACPSARQSRTASRKRTPLHDVSKVLKKKECSERHCSTHWQHQLFKMLLAPSLKPLQQRHQLKTEQSNKTVT